jgi:hypothetical protein
VQQRLTIYCNATELRELHTLTALAATRSPEDTLKLAVRVLSGLAPALEGRATALLRYADGKEERLDLR